MNAFEKAKARNADAIRIAMKRFRRVPAPHNLALVIELVNAKPRERRAMPRIQGWQIVED